MARNIKTEAQGSASPEHPAGRAPARVQPRIFDINAEEIFSTTAMLGAIQQQSLAPRYFRDMFFPRTETTTADVIWLDQWVETSQMAGFVSNYAKGHHFYRERTVSRIYKPPKIAPIRLLTSNDAFARRTGGGFGDGSVDPDMLAQDYSTLDKAIGRTEEWLCAQVLFFGRAVIEDYDTNRQLGILQYDPVIETVLSDPWTDPNSTPLEDIKVAMRYVSGNAAVTATVVIFGSHAADLFEANASVKDAFSRFFIEPGRLTPQQESVGLINLGTWRGLNLLVNESVFKDKFGNVQPYMPPNMVLVAAETGLGIICYAGVSQPPSAADDPRAGIQTYEGERIPYIYYPPTLDARALRVTSRPVPIPDLGSNRCIINVDPAWVPTIAAAPPAPPTGDVPPTESRERKMR